MHPAMDKMHGPGARCSKELQVDVKDGQGSLLLSSFVGDRWSNLFIIFPSCFQLHEAVDLKLLWVTAIGDWLNLVFKWILFGERPYWWVHETPYYSNTSVPHIEQFPMTCETGPGSPSGHAMGAAGVYYAMVTSILTIMLSRKTTATTNRLYLRGTLWTLFWTVQICVCLSRVFLAAHFPHQVIAGVISGMIVAEVFNRQRWIYYASLQRYFNITLFLLAFAVGFYVLLKAVGVDLLWTLEKAQTWCVNPAWVHLDTTPFASLLRNMGTLFCLGLGLHSPLYTESKKSSNAIDIITCFIAFLLLLHLFDSIKPPTHTDALFYLLSFCKSATVPLVTVSIIPYCVSGAMSLPSKKHL
uniref:Glucose-6-phosphatase n=1 Tax=Clarias batrachus TaxID=59899 RepID=S5MHJ5_CLABA|nr:glucose-6-phosphatase [Clarias batrachus]